MNRSTADVLVVIILNDGSRLTTEISRPSPRGWVDAMANIGDELIIHGEDNLQDKVDGVVYIDAENGVNQYTKNEAHEILFGA